MGLLGGTIFPQLFSGWSVERNRKGRIRRRGCSGVGATGEFEWKLPTRPRGRPAELRWRVPALVEHFC